MLVDNDLSLHEILLQIVVKQYPQHAAYFLVQKQENQESSMLCHHKEASSLQRGMVEIKWVINYVSQH
jgi:hypothetical protein